MLEVLVQMAGLILCGIAWRWREPGGLAATPTRKVLTSLVYYLLLPALVLSVLWQAELGSTSLVIAVSAGVAVIAGMLLSLLSCRLCRADPRVTGAIVLAASFPNATYLGLPVLEAAFGPWARSVAIQYDLFACTPLLFTLGIFVAARFGAVESSSAATLRELARIPALWAAAVAVVLNLGDVPLPSVLAGLLQMLERGVVPLMLFSLGLSLSWQSLQWRVLPSVMPAILIRLLIVPLLIVVLVSGLGVEGDVFAAIVMESAMPSMVLGLVFCDRFNLDVGIYAAAVTLSTLLSLITLPIWFDVLQGMAG